MTAGARLPSYSPSQVATFTDCPRKWGFAKIDRLPTPQHRSATFGEALHEIAERYLRGGGIWYHPGPNPSKAAQIIGPAEYHRAAELVAVGAPLLPAPASEGLSVEHAFDGVRLSDAPHGWTGRIDWMLRPDVGHLVIGDHKSTSQIDAWAKTESELHTDIQSNVYARWGFLAFPDVESVDLQWTYYQTRGAKRAHPVHVTLTRAEVENRFSEIDRIALDMTAARSAVSAAIDLPPNPETCDKYGGCPFTSRCNLSPLERMKSTMSNGSDLYSRLSGKPGATAPAPLANAPHAIPTANPAPMPSPAAQPQATAPAITQMGSMLPRDASGRVTHAMSRRPLDPRTVATQYVYLGGNSYRPIDPTTPDVIEALEAAASHFAAHPELSAWTPPAEQPAPAPYSPPQAPAPAWAPPGAVAPPAAPPVVATPAPAPTYTPPLPVAPGQINPPEAAIAGPGVQAPAPQAAPMPSPEAAPAEGGKVRKCSICGGTSHNARSCPGRPLNAAPEAPAPQAPAPMPSPEAPHAPSASVQGTPAPTEANASRAMQAAAAEIAKSNPGRLALFIGCRPGKGWQIPIVEASDVFAEAGKRIVRDGGPSDYNLIDFKGVGVFATVLGEVLREAMAGREIAIYLDPRAREASIAISVLEAAASLVVRGAL